jgi:UDP-2,3-diacylglucosamine pyrophosphatase LpxH
MKAIVVSDLHIGSRYFQCALFERFLEKLPADHDFILNGDIVDAPYAKMQPSDRKIFDRITQLSHRQKVIWIRGNHDNGYVPAPFGQAVLAPYHIVADRLLITHGDDFDEIMPRSRWFIRAFNLLHDLRIKLGAKPVHVAQYAKKWPTLYGVLRKNVALNAIECAAAMGLKAVACGHTHFAEDRVISGIRYLNTGAWTEVPVHCLHVASDEIVLTKMETAAEPRHQESALFN